MDPTSPVDAPGAPPPPAASPARRRRGWALALGTLALLVLMLGGLLSLPYQGWGTRALLNLLPALEVEGAQGALLGDFSARRIRVPLNPQQTLVLEQPSWRGATLHRDGTGWMLSIEALHVARLELQGQAPDDGQPPTLPHDLTLPLAVHIGQLTIAAIDAPPLQGRPVRDVRAALELGRGATAQHRLRGLALQWDRLRAQGDLSLQAAAPLRLAAQLALSSLPVPARDGTAAPTAPTLVDIPWQASVTAQGPLARLALAAHLTARDQTLDAQALVELAAAQPLKTLGARAQALNLAALSSAWPRTALTGTVAARLDGGAGEARPVEVSADLRNDRPGRWDQGLLPLRLLQATARGSLATPDRGELTRLRVELAQGSQDAGRVDAQGHWRRAPGPGTGRPWQFAIQARLQDVRPHLLDQRGPALRIGGPLEAQWAQAGAASTPGTTDDRFALRAQLQGERVLAPGEAGTRVPLQLRIDAQGTPRAAEVRTFEARAGSARLAGSGRIERVAAGAAVRLDARMEAFDPSVWWPGLGGASKQPYRLDGQLQGDLRWPGPATAAGDRTTGLARLQGQAQLQLSPGTVVAGVPLTGEATLRSPPAHPGTLEAAARLRVGRPAGAGATQNTQTGELALTGTIDRVRQNDRWNLRWQLPRLDTVAPWLQLAAPGQGLSGEAEGVAQATGRWPQLRTTGQLAAAQLRWQGAPQPPTPGGKARAAASVELQRASLQWQAGSRPEDPLHLEARLAAARVGTVAVDATALQVTGTGHDHRVQITGAAWLPDSDATGGGTTAVTARTPASRRFETALQAQGGWFQQAGRSATTTGWQGRITQWEVREPAAPGAPPPRTTTVWLRSAPTALRLAHTTPASATDAAETSLRLDPVQLTLADAQVTLEALQWQQRSGQAPSFTLQARLAPTALAPWLARMQPDFGWLGDLRVAGSLALRGTPAGFSADATLSRLDGDLQVREPDSAAPPQGLGLTALRLGLQARDGLWRFSQDVGGSALGTLKGEQTLRTPPAALWPGRDTALAGQLRLQSAQLGQWGHWLPLGWRVAGELAGEVRLDGQLGTPRLDGELTGRRLAVRNLLQGVDWHDAELRVALAGDTVRLERLRVHAGAGTLDITGRTVLAANPRLELQARAERFAALQRVDRRVVLSGEADALLDATTTRLNARLTADEGRIDFSRSDAPGLADDVRVRRPGDADEGSPVDVRTARSGRSTQLDVRADLGPAFKVSGRGLAARLAGELRLTSPANRLQLAGTIQAVDGTYAAYGQKLQIERGTIAFAGPMDNPRLDVRAVRDDLDEVRVGVAITGTALAPRVRLYSDPDMSDADRLSWLLLGRGPDGLGRTDLALLQRAAYALLTGESDSPSVLQRLGLDSLSVSQTDGTVRETVVSLGKQLSRRWYVGYERSLQATAGSWQLIYRVAQRFTLRAQSGSENALDLIWTWRWGS